MAPRTIIAIIHDGDRIPFDGTVIDGLALVDESAETGVSTPVWLEAVPGRDNAIAGTLILEGWLKVESPLNARMRKTDGPKREPEVPFDDDWTLDDPVFDKLPPPPRPSSKKWLNYASVLLAGIAVAAVFGLVTYAASHNIPAVIVLSIVGFLFGAFQRRSDLKR